MKEKPGDVDIRRSSAASAEFGWYREIQHRFVPIIWDEAVFFSLKGGKIMLDVKMIRNNFTEVNEKLATRGVKEEILKRFLELD